MQNDKLLKEARALRSAADRGQVRSLRLFCLILVFLCFTACLN